MVLVVVLSYNYGTLTSIPTIHSTTTPQQCGGAIYNDGTLTSYPMIHSTTTQQQHLILGLLMVEAQFTIMVK